ncbi:homocysteine S-methyltransferase [Paraferrimonas sp. SM1919]|uniref:homocysteine S-methyltransferase n=1 Tax=Paraferrimonas sp. SM1919 TaxID=2662263 RepID=UPI0013D2D405|nr:homocysteine S-methyltransferase [Paraferrimonas sp. SM1919]
MSISAFKHNLLNLELPLVLDGGLASQLEAMGHDLNHPLWSAKLLLEQPEAIIAAHIAFLEAGADCIITSSYQASVQGFAELGLRPQQIEQAMALASTLAVEARTRFMLNHCDRLQPLIAASVGPYGAVLANGAEYHGNYGINDADLERFHFQRLLQLNLASVDVILFETIPSLQEIKVITELAPGLEKPIWLSLSCQNGYRLNDGNAVTDAIKLINGIENIHAIGINCTAPKYITELIETLKANTDLPILVYPNSGESYDAGEKCWHGDSDVASFVDNAKGWSRQGVKIIGGCCRVTPRHINALAELFH